MDLPKQFDNITQRVIDDLRVTIQRGGKLSVAAASFSIYAFEALRKELSQIEELRFIFTSPTFNKEHITKQKREFYIPKLNRERTLYGSEFEIKLRNKLDQKAIARECAEWIRQKAKFKTNISQMNMPGFLNVKTDGEFYTYMPFNEFTTTELGCERGNNIFQLIQRLPSPISDAYLRNFNDFWLDKTQVADVTEAVIENIENVYRENSPDFIYFVTLYNIFHEFLEDISEDVLPNEATGFKSSQIWSKLYNFQKDAALALNVTDSETMKEIEVFVATLKQGDCPTDLFSFIDENMPQHIVFILEYEGNAMLLINYKDWKDDTHTKFKITQSFSSLWVPLQELSLSVDGQSLPRIYENFVAQVGGIGEHKAGTMAEIVALRKRIAAMETEVRNLQARVRKEPEFNLQMEMNKQVKAKRKELEKLKQEINTLL